MTNKQKTDQEIVEEIVKDDMCLNGHSTPCLKMSIKEGIKKARQEEREKINKKIEEIEKRNWDCKNCGTVNENADVCKKCGDKKEFSDDNQKLQELKQEKK